MHCKLSPPIPKCSLYAKTFKKTQAPIYDALGPFPDEILMSTIDRCLYLFGGRKIQKYFSSERSSNEVETCSCCSVEKQVTHNAHHNCGSDVCYVKESPTYSVIEKSKYSKCELCSDKSTSYRESPLRHYSNTPRISINENSCRRGSKRFGTPLRTLKKSFSLCSLACRKLKEKFSIPSNPSTPAKWLWTKMQNYDDDCQVYEVFKNSSAASHPSTFDTCIASKLIFVILPTGIIMPFETLPRH